MPRVMRALTALMGLLFLLALAVQYNDPDWPPWMAIYGSAALACLLALRGRLPRGLPALVGAVAAVWAVTLVPRVVGQVAPSEVFREVAMASLAIEEARETGGLLIVAVWMLVLLARPDLALPGRDAGRRPGSET